MITAHDEEIKTAATFYGLPLDLLRAQVLHESAGMADAFRFEQGFYDRYIRKNASARGYRYGPLAACSYGLIQIVLETALEEGFDGQPWDLFIPRIGLAFGCKHMRTLWDGLGSAMESYQYALARYNGTGDAALAYAEAIFAAAGRSV